MIPIFRGSISDFLLCKKNFFFHFFVLTSLKTFKQDQTEPDRAIKFFEFYWQKTHCAFCMVFITYGTLLF